jgi:hypothetical protein
MSRSRKKSDTDLLPIYGNLASFSADSPPAFLLFNFCCPHKFPNYGFFWHQYLLCTEVNKEGNKISRRMEHFYSSPSHFLSFQLRKTEPKIKLGNLFSV